MSEEAIATEENPTSLEPQDWGSSKGLMETLAENLDGAAPEAAPAPVEEVAQEVVDPEPQAKPEEVESATAEAAKAVEEVAEEEFKMDDGFSDEDGEEESKPEEGETEGFDEKAFDLQTEEDSKGMEEKAGAKFKSLRAELKEHKQREKSAVVPEEAQARIKELELKVAESEGLKERISEMSAQSAKMQMENEPDYQRLVVEPVADVLSRADALSKMYEGEPSVLRAIIKERDRKTQNDLISQHLDGFSDFDKSEVYRMAQEFNGALANRDKLMSNAEAEVEKNRNIRAQQEAKLFEDQRIAVQTQQKSLFERYKDVVPGLVDSSGDTDQLRSLMNKALSIDFSKAKANDMAFGAFAGTLLPHTLKEMVKMKKQLAAYEASDSKSLKQAASPSSSVTPTAVEDGKPKTFMEAMGGF